MEYRVCTYVRVRVTIQKEIKGQKCATSETTVTQTKVGSENCRGQKNKIVLF